MSSYSVVVNNIDYDVDGTTKTYETVYEVKQTNTDLSNRANHYSIEFYDTSLLDKIYKDGVFYDTAADVPAE
jgi:hypothetical protein